jgi:hypothetical protein
MKKTRGNTTHPCPAWERKEDPGNAEDGLYRFLAQDKEIVFFFLRIMLK